MIEQENGKKLVHQRYKEDQKRRDEEGDVEDYENDILAPFVEKKDLKKKLELNKAREYKQKILSKYKERIVSRADIIDKRIKQENKYVIFGIYFR